MSLSSSLGYAPTAGTIAFMHWFPQAVIAAFLSWLAGAIIFAGSLALYFWVLRTFGEWSTIVMGSLITSLAMVALIVLWRRRHLHCRKCVHILRGISEPRCPECGEKI